MFERHVKFVASATCGTTRLEAPSVVLVAVVVVIFLPGDFSFAHAPSL